MSESILDRRGFLASALPLCCTSTPAPEHSFQIQGSKLLLDLSRIPELHKTGSAVAVIDEGRKLNLIVIRSASREYNVLNRACTHGGASCAYQQRTKTLRCTSLNHAEYTLDGTLLHGRTHGNLRMYPVRLRGSVLEIELETRA